MRNSKLKLLLLAMLVLPACSHELRPETVREALVRQLQQGAFASRTALRDLYARHGQRLLWSDPRGTPLARTETLLQALRGASGEGLNPEDYDLRRLESLQQESAAARGGRRTALLTDFDLRATAALLRYAADVSSGRVHPGEVQSDWHLKPPEIDVEAALDQALERDDLETVLASLPPPDPGYARLRDALRELRRIEALGGWPSIPDGPKLEPRSRGSRVALLRRRLQPFDGTLSDAVRRFQAQHGVEPDGVVGKDTLAELNVPVARRIRQIELNLERWRWMPRRLEDSHVLVNIPGFDLVWTKVGAPTWHTRVVAGKAYTPTPVFSDRIVGIVVNPAWNVPESIAVNEYLPELRKDARFLAHKGLRLLQGSGDKEREVDARDVDWKNVDGEHFPFHLRQDPGPENPLGRIKFDLTNDFHVYLHDTPAGGAFGRAERDLSHGCIRVQNALELAYAVADEAAAEKIREALEQSEMRRIDLATKVPVHILYWTAWTDGLGALHFGPDVYAVDDMQQAALDRMGAATNASLMP